jgi:hypothetical protein
MVTQFILMILSEIIYEMIVIPLIALLAVPFILIAAIPGTGSYWRRVSVYTTRLWRRLKQGSFLGVLDSGWNRRRKQLAEK